MKSIHFILALSASVLLFAVSCSKEKAVDAVDEDLVSEAKAIPLDDALKALDSFVAEFDSDNLITKSAAARKIAGVETHYSGLLTKSGEKLPDAYIVNYENEGGFAVLGANTDVAPVVAYTEDGSFDAENLEHYFSSLTEAPVDMEFDEEGFPLVGKPCPRIVEDAIGSAVTNTNTTRSSTVSNDYVAPLVKTKWHQGKWDEVSCYNKYCRYNGHYAFVGCTALAVAQVMAYNKCVDTAFDYSKMITTGHLAEYAYIYPDKVDRTSRFIGSVFEHLVLSADEDGTRSSLGEVRKYLRWMDGYENICVSWQNSFTNAVIATAKGMLKEGKPVIVSAAGKTVSNCHAWILDGYKYFNGALYFHCNWGYGGRYDGYFSADWFSLTATNAKYDDQELTQRNIDYSKQKGQDISQDYCWWVNLLTYDLQ